MLMSLTKLYKLKYCLHINTLTYNLTVHLADVKRTREKYKENDGLSGMPNQNYIRKR